MRNLGSELSTKLEFIWRYDDLPFSRGLPDRALLSEYRVPPFGTQYYDAVPMIVQKLLALASANRNAARDLFDLHHLMERRPPGLIDVIDGVGEKVVQAAVANVDGFRYADFRGQVLPFLTPELVRVYEVQESFDRLKAEARQSLVGDSA